MPFKNFFNRNSAQPSSVSSAAEPALLSPWQAQNGETLDELARFVDFAEGFTIGFLEINFPEDLDNTLKVMQSRRECTGVSFHIFSLGDPNLQFLKDDLENRIQQIPTSVSLLIENKKGISISSEMPGLSLCPIRFYFLYRPMQSIE